MDVQALLAHINFIRPQASDVQGLPSITQVLYCVSFNNELLRNLTAYLLQLSNKLGFLFIEGVHVKLQRFDALFSSLHPIRQLHLFSLNLS